VEFGGDSAEGVGSIGRATSPTYTSMLAKMREPLEESTSPLGDGANFIIRPTSYKKKIPGLTARDPTQMDEG
jgi:hypothetical protein